MKKLFLIFLLNLVSYNSFAENTEQILNRVFSSSDNTLKATITGTASLDSLTVTGTPSRITFSDGSYLGVDSSVFSYSASGKWDWINNNIIYLTATDDIETAITNASSGDTIILSSGTYTITDDIDISKAINIIGQGIGKTTISTSTNDINVFTVVASNVRISNLSISMSQSGGSTSCNAIRFDGTAGTVLSGCRVNNVDFSLTSASTTAIRAVFYIDAGGTFSNLTGTLTQTSSGQVSAIEHRNQSTAESVTRVYGYDSDFTIDNTGTSTQVYAFFNIDNSSSNDSISFIKNCRFIANDTGGTATCQGLRVDGSDAIFTAENSTFYGVDNDNSNQNSSSTTLINCNLLNDIPSSLNTYDGTTVFGNSLVSGYQQNPTKTIVANDTTPDVSNGTFFITSANSGATAITDLDNPKVGQTIYIIGGSNTNSSTIADSGNFNLSGAFTASLDDVLILYVQADNDYIEIGRVNN